MKRTQVEVEVATEKVSREDMAIYILSCCGAESEW